MKAPSTKQLKEAIRFMGLHVTTAQHVLIPGGWEWALSHRVTAKNIAHGHTPGPERRALLAAYESAVEKGY